MRARLRRGLGVLSILLVAAGAQAQEVIGNIDGIAVIGGGDHLAGWACARGNDSPISVHLYAGGAAGAGGQLLTGALANSPSEPAVAAACSANGSTYRFYIPLRDFEAQFKNQGLYVHGISPVGLSNNLLWNSGTFKMPLPKQKPGLDWSGDGKADFAVYRPSDGTWWVKDVVHNVQWGAAGDVPVPGDYSGDGKTDFAVYRPSDGTWWVKDVVHNVQWGLAGDVPVPGDYNGDGKTDFAVYRPSDGTWWVKDITSVQWGVPGDVPAQGDYNGDGKTDFAVYRPSDGTWWVKDVIYNVQWGVPGDVPVQGDYNGDGKTDFAVYRPSDGTWWVKDVIYNVQWGARGDVPVQGDYNGDWKADFAVYRPSDGTWWVKDVVHNVQWGAQGDVPISDLTGKSPRPLIAPRILTPDNGAVLNVATPSVTVSWAGVPGVARYLVRLRDEATGAMVTLDDAVTATQTTAPLVAGHAYTFWIHSARAYFSYDDPGSYGEAAAVAFSASAAPQLPPPQILSPVAGAVLESTTQSVTVSWAGVPGVSRFLVRLRDETTGAMVVYDDTVKGTQITAPVAAGHAYSFWIHSATVNFSYEDPKSYGPAASVAFSVAAAHDVTGVIDGIAVIGGANYLSGWACARGIDSPISVHLYAGGPAGTGQLVTGALANAPSEPAVAAACSAKGSTYRFVIPLRGFEARFKGQALYVHGISPVGLPNNLLTNSGSFTMPLNDAAVSAEEIPSQVAPGQAFTVSITVRNAGDTTWSPEAGYKIGTWNPADDTKWGVSRLLMAAGTSVAPGGSSTFRGSLTAPSTPGTYSMQWRMVKEGVEWFGGTSSLRQIVVAAPRPANDATVVTQEIPTEVGAGETFTIAVTVQNKGSATWSPQSGHKLGSWNPMDDRTWGPNRLTLAAGASVPPDGTYTFRGSLTAPSAPATYTMQWRMVQEGVEWFGGTSPLVTVVVRSSGPVEYRVHLKNQRFARFVVAEGGGGQVVNCNREAPSSWETFTLSDHNGLQLEDGDPVSLRTYDGLHYVTTPNGGGGRVVATATTVGVNETFTIHRVGGQGPIKFGTKIALQAENGQYVNAEVQGDGSAAATFYDDIEYQGASFSASSDVAFVGWDWNDRISSIKTGGCKVTGYQDSQYGGGSKALTSDTPDLRDYGINDWISSVQVDCSGAPGNNIILNAMRWSVGPDETFTLLREGTTSGHEPRPGRVRLENRALRDDAGAFNGLGTTLFWAAWGYRHDRARLEQNLQFLADSGFDYIRVLGSVGSDDPKDAWSGRAADPRWPDYDQVIAGLTDLAYQSYGLRIEWTLFGGLGFTPSAASRQALVDRFAAMARGREQAIMMFEVANEGFNNGFGGSDGIAELRSLTRRLNDATDVLVAASAYIDGNEHCAVNAGGVANLATIHFDRTNNIGDGVWRPIRQPWSWTEYPCSDLPPAASNNEPIGPASSVATDSDPLRMVMAAAVSYVSGLPLHVFHTGNGVFGREDPARNRQPNLWEVENIDAIARGYQAMKTYLPAGLQNWSRQNAHWASYPFYNNADQFVRAYAATNGSEVVAVPIGMRNPVSMAPKARMHLEAIDPLSGAVLAAWDLDAGQWVTLPTADALVLHGVYR